MNVFRISIYGWDNYKYELFSHPSKNKIEFIGDFKQVVLNYDICNSDKCITGNDLLEYVFAGMEDIGYSIVKPISIDLPDPGIFKDSDNAEWIKVIGKEKLTKLSKHNSKVIKKIKEEYD